MILKISILFISYLLGSIPTGFIFGKFLKNIDLREIGSGSTGATNVLRNVGKWPALFVFIIDVLKGFISVELAHIFLKDNYFEVMAGLIAISGHIWPIWLRGKGGKAVATGLGMFLALSFKVGFAALGIFLLILSKFKIVSLASIIAAFFLPILMYINVGLINHPFTIMSFIVSILVIWKHRTNIKRLMKGVEPKINKN
mgnify:FL=1|tara:strand:+ start:250 stop:846 length:597 start_codon:yes stop_codon:yes gene_type:complete